MAARNHSAAPVEEPVALAVALKKSEGVQAKVEACAEELASTNDTVKSRIAAGATTVSARGALADSEKVEDTVQECAGDLEDINKTLAHGIADLKQTEAALSRSRTALTDTEARLAAVLEEEKTARGRATEVQAQLRDHAAELERLVTERTAELTATNQQLEAVIYSIAHDLRAPLRAMQGFSQLLVKDVGAILNAACRGYADRINESAQFMDALLRDLLAFSRVSQQRVELTPVSLATVVESVLSRLQEDITAGHARVDNAGPWPAVLAHAPTLRQVLFNLICNALKFTVPGVAPRVRLRTEKRGEFIRVWVEDNGVGIAQDHQEEIFRLFTRLHGEQYPGTGTGLTIVRKAMERMSGQAGVESAPLQGSRFWFEIAKA